MTRHTLTTRDGRLAVVECGGNNLGATESEWRDDAESALLPSAHGAPTEEQVAVGGGQSVSGGE